MSSVRRSETKGTRTDASIRSKMKRRGGEIFRTVPRIVLLRFPQDSKPPRRMVPSARSDLARTNRPDADKFAACAAIAGRSLKRSIYGAGEARGLVLSTI